MNPSELSWFAELQQQAEQRHAPEVAWQSAAAVIGVLLWHDEFSRAVSLTERTLADLGTRSTRLISTIVPFSTAFLAAAGFTDEPMIARIRTSAEALPSDATLHQQLDRLANRIENEPVESVLTPPTRRMSPRQPGRRERDLLSRDWASLPAEHQRLLWTAAKRSDDIALADRLAATLDTFPTDWQTLLWYARWYIRHGQDGWTEAILRSGATVFNGHAPWAQLPLDLITDPDLRPALSPRVRQAYLTEAAPTVHTPAMTDPLNTLLAAGRGLLTRAARVHLGTTTGPVGELAELLTGCNGFYAANAGLHVFPAGTRHAWGYDLATWNQSDTWKDTYGPHAGDLVCLVQDLVGVQFAIDRHDQICAFDPETAARTHIGSSLREWAVWLQAYPDQRTAGPLATAWQDHHRALEPHERLIPVRWFAHGGQYRVANLRACDAAVAMRARGPLARQLCRVLDGSRVTITTWGDWT